MKSSKALKTALYVAQPSPKVQLAQRMIVDHLKAHGRSTPRELVSMLKERQVQEWETREAMSRLMSSGDIRIDRDWRLVPEP